MTQNQLMYAQLKETQRANIARETETHRSNTARESIEWANLRQRAFEYSDMAPYNKALAEARAKEARSAVVKNITQAGKNTAETSLAIAKTARTLIHIWNPTAK